MIHQWRVPQSMSLAQAARSLGVSELSLIRLNPFLKDAYEVWKGTLLHYSPERSLGALGDDEEYDDSYDEEYDDSAEEYDDSAEETDESEVEEYDDSEVEEEAETDEESDEFEEEEDAGVEASDEDAEEDEEADESEDEEIEEPEETEESESTGGFTSTVNDLIHTFNSTGLLPATLNNLTSLEKKAMATAVPAVAKMVQAQVTKAVTGPATKGVTTAPKSAPKSILTSSKALTAAAGSSSAMLPVIGLSVVGLYLLSKKMKWLS